MRPPASSISSFDLSVLLFLQLAFVLAVCRVVRIAARKLRQSPVVSEMIAGVLMGPSLMGWLSSGLSGALTPSVARIWSGHSFPDISAMLFPEESKPILFALCQVGLVLYMFMVGVEFDRELIKSRLRSAAAVSIAGIAAPFALGGAIAFYVADDRLLFPETTSASEAILFMGAAMSITAFPMLARIICEQGLGNTPLGALALAAGLIDDAAAWSILALVLASSEDDLTIALRAIGGGAAYTAVTLLWVKRWLRSLGRAVEQTGEMSHSTLAGVLTLTMLAAWFTDYIRIYAVFGAFVMGMAMPRGKFSAELHRMLQPISAALLLPVFFFYSGLNTKVGLVNTPYLWLLTGIIVLAAAIGKGGACFLAARLYGESTRDALALGTLMNARGTMELIILNVGLQVGLIEPPLFAMMVLMALATTLMTSPIFERIHSGRPRSIGVEPALAA